MVDTVTTPHIRLTFGGTYFATEQWQAGLHFSHGTLGSDDLVAFAGDHIADAKSDLVAWVGESGAGLSRQCSLDWVKMNAIGTDGRYLDPDHVHQLTVSPAVVPPSDSNAPYGWTAPQLALCVSLRSAIAGPRASHGRVFLPTQGYTVATTGHLSSTVTNTIAQNFKTLVVNLNNWPGVTVGDPVVALVTPQSPARAASPGVPARAERASRVEPVSAIWVGDMLDTQRRRRKDIPESYVKVQIAD